MPSDFGNRLRKMREDIPGLSQEKLAKKLKQQRPSTVQGWESGRLSVPRPKTLIRLANALGCEPADLLSGVVTDFDRMRGPRVSALIEIASQLPIEALEGVLEAAIEVGKTEGIDLPDEPHAESPHEMKRAGRTTRRAAPHR